MGHARAVLAVALLLGSAQAAEKSPAMVWVGTAPSGACKGSRVALLAATGARWCCVAGTWASCDPAPGGGSGLPADPAACTSGQYVIDQDASGVLACAQVQWGQLGAVPSTFAPATHTHPQTDLTATGRSTTNFLRGDNTWANEDWATLTGKPATFPATTPVSTATALAGTPAACTGSDWMKSITSAGVTTCAQPAYSDISGAPAAYTLPAASTTLGGVKMAAACSAGNHVNSIGAGGELGCTADASAAHTLMGATHSDVDTAAPSAGDIVIRNAANSQWSHMAIGGANTVLHGGTTAPTFFAVDLSADTAATVLPMTKGGTGANLTGTVGALLSPTSSTVVGQIADVAVGAALVSGGVGVAPSYSATGTCTSSASTTCTITGRRSGCLPVCGLGTAASTWVKGTLSTTTITCTFSTSGTNTCNCICF